MERLGAEGVKGDAKRRVTAEPVAAPPKMVAPGRIKTVLSQSKSNESAVGGFYQAFVSTPWGEGGIIVETSRCSRINVYFLHLFGILAASS